MSLYLDNTVLWQAIGVVLGQDTRETGDASARRWACPVSSASASASQAAVGSLHSASIIPLPGGVRSARPEIKIKITKFSPFLFAGCRR
jgi:hypothetical protein